MAKLKESDRTKLLKGLKALSEPTRLHIFDMLMEGVQCSCEISRRLSLSRSLISHHMRALKEAGLVKSERDPADGRWIYYSVDKKALNQLRHQLYRMLDPQRIQPRVPSCGPDGCCQPDQGE